MQFLVAILIFKLCALALAQNECFLMENFVKYKNFTLFTDDGTLLRTPIVEIGQSIHCICNEYEPITQSTCTAYGTLEPPLPYDQCEKALSTTIHVVTNEPKCKEPAKLYQVGYTYGNSFNELYSSCYNPDTMEAFYVENQVIARPFEGKRPECEFELNGIISPFDGLSFRKDKVYDRFVELLGYEQKFITHRNMKIIDRGHLAPASDFLFVRHKCATFKYINVVPQFASINAGNWILVEDYARTFTKDNDVNNIVTGTSEVLELPHSTIPNKMVKMYLLNNKNPIPKFIYKVVNTIVFVNYNNPFATSLPDDLPCDPGECPDIVKGSGASLADFRTGFIFCCRKLY